jgi:hypothetical protein
MDLSCINAFISRSRKNDSKLRELLAIKEKEIAAQQMRIDNLVNQEKKNQKKLKEVKVKLMQSSGGTATHAIDHEVPILVFDLVIGYLFWFWIRFLDSALGLILE